MVLRYKNIHAFDNNKTMKIIYSMYRAGEVSVHRACCERATQPYSLGGGGTICPVSRPAGFTTRCPRMVTECLLTRSMLIKMYKFTISGCLYMYIVLTVSQFHTDVHLVYLVFFFFCLTRQFYQKSWVWVIYSGETSNQAKAKSLSNFTLPYSLLICSISACSQHQYLLPWLNFSCVYHLTCRKKEQKKERTVLQ